MADALARYDRREFTAEGFTRTVWSRGDGPGVLVMHEIPGITPQVVAFADRLVDAGFTVDLPDLLGEAGAPPTPASYATSTARLCISREFQAFARRADRPIIAYLRALGRDLHERCEGPGIGAIGMCMTGGFALALAVDPHVLAPVLSQPSLPVGISPWHARDLGLPDEDAEVVASRTRDEDLPILGLRFRGDLLCPPPRFRALEARFGDAFEAIELDDGEWRAARRRLPDDEVPPTLTGLPHSVVGGDYLDAEPTRSAMARVVELFTAQLVEPRG